MSAIRNVMKNFARNAELDEFLGQEIGDAGYGGAEVLKTPVGTRITIFVTRPGLVIGRRGVGIRALTEEIGRRFDLQNPQISVLEIEVPELVPAVMCNKIAHLVSRGTAFRRAALWTLNSIMRAGAMGAEISISGKLRSERSHNEKYREGVVPKSGEMAKRVVREAKQDALLKMGLYGIKVKIALKEAVPSEVEIKAKEEAKSVEAEAPVKEVEFKEEEEATAVEETEKEPEVAPVEAEPKKMKAEAKEETPVEDVKKTETETAVEETKPKTKGVAESETEAKVESEAKAEKKPKAKKTAESKKAGEEKPVKAKEKKKVTKDEDTEA